MSLIELLVGLVVVTTLALTILPAMATVRDQSQNEMSRANLIAFGQGRDQYALDHKDRIFSYTWRAEETYIMPDGRQKTFNDDQSATAYQNGEILMRHTGRIRGIYKIQSFAARIPHRRYSHLILLDYLSDSSEAFLTNLLGIDPADENQLVWHERPLQYNESGSGFPYMNGIPSGYDDDTNWPTNPVRQRWPFASSYQVVPHAWQGDGNEGVFRPTTYSPHLFIGGDGILLGRRYTSEVAFPAQKVHMHEEFDYEQSRYPYFAYDHARPEKLMFDGSINSRPSGVANDSVSPDDYDLNNPQDPSVYPVWTQRYVPLDAFPIPLGGLDDDTELNMRYRWTLFGLQGVDYD
jgi:type II secretory pathway pseudopilin PulG